MSSYLEERNRVLTDQNAALKHRVAELRKKIDEAWPRVLAANETRAEASNDLYDLRSAIISVCPDLYEKIISSAADQARQMRAHVVQGTKH